jgi:hypothetical protein
VIQGRRWNAEITGEIGTWRKSMQQCVIKLNAYPAVDAYSYWDLHAPPN